MCVGWVGGLSHSEPTFYYHDMRFFFLRFSIRGEGREGDKTSSKDEKMEGGEWKAGGIVLFTVKMKRRRIFITYLSAITKHYFQNNSLKLMFLTNWGHENGLKELSQNHGFLLLLSLFIYFHYCNIVLLPACCFGENRIFHIEVRNELMGIISVCNVFWKNDFPLWRTRAGTKL